MVRSLGFPWLAALLLAAAPVSIGAPPPAISHVGATPAAFIPSLKQKVALTFVVGQKGTLTVQVLDRDGFLVRTLASKTRARPGKVEYLWDGRDDAGQVVADEAYSFRIELVNRAGTKRYFPADAEPEMLEASPGYYDRQGGTLVYDLKKPARVHAQAGTAVKDEKTGQMVGPVLKTLVNREPRSAGRVADAWNGMDEGGTIYIPELPNFVTSLMATALPENAVIATGNRNLRFLDYAAGRKGKSLFTFVPTHHHHHLGLTALQDVSPPLELKVEGAKWDAAARVWELVADPLRLTATPVGPSAAGFSRLPANGEVYLADRPLQRKPITTPSPLVFEVSRDEIGPGTHVLAIGWGTDYGPSACNALRITVPQSVDSGDGKEAAK